MQHDIALRFQREHLSESHSDTLRSLSGMSMGRWWNGKAEARWPDGVNHFHRDEPSRGEAGGPEENSPKPLLRKGYEGLFHHQDRLFPFLNAPCRITESLERLAQLS